MNAEPVRLAFSVTACIAACCSALDFDDDWKYSYPGIRYSPCAFADFSDASTLSSWAFEFTPISPTGRTICAMKLQRNITRPATIPPTVILVIIVLSPLDCEYGMRRLEHKVLSARKLNLLRGLFQIHSSRTKFWRTK